MCTRAQSDRPSLWACTVAGTIAVVHLDSVPDTGSVTMVPTAEVNSDKSVHQGAIMVVAEAFVTAAGSSVLLSGDIAGNIGVRM